MPAEPAEWSIEFFPPGDSNPPPKKAMGELGREERVEVGHWLEQLRMLGPYKLQETRRVEKITDRKEELFELRIHVGRRQFRAFFCIRGHRLCILHFVGKKKDRLTKDIDTAERRAKLLSS